MMIYRCALAEDARHNARRNLGRDIDLETLLYTNDGIPEALKIWKEFGEAKGECRQRTGGREVERERRETQDGDLGIWRSERSGPMTNARMYLVEKQRGRKRECVK